MVKEKSNPKTSQTPRRDRISNEKEKPAEKPVQTALPQEPVSAAPIATAPPEPGLAPQPQEPAAGKSFPIVGIGASAGGLEAFRLFLRSLPADTGMAFVLVQHMDPTHESMLNRLLAKDTAMPVTQVTNNMPVEPNCVYVIPPNTEMRIHQGVLRLVARPGGATRHTPIDTFLRSLAEDQKSKAMGIVLSGIGSDGTKGLQAIKAEGGITLAQDEGSARYPGMPLHAIGAGCVDLVLPPDTIAQELAQIARHPYLELAPQEPSPELPPVEDGSLHKILRLLRSTTGVDLANYKQTTVRRRIARRMVVRRCETLAQYASYVEAHPDEVNALFQDVLIHVTSFFREPDVFRSLQASIFPRIAASLEAGQPIRIWVPGCSTGEEVYSTIIAFHEYLGETANAAGIQVFGTDISTAAVEKARAGIYSDSVMAEVSPERLRRYFVPVEGGHQIAKTIRELCVFARHDLTKDPPFSRMDLISCRNVLIYMNPVLQKRVLNYFHYALKPTGFLVLGQSEGVSAAGDLFSLEDRKGNVYSKEALPARPVPEFRQEEYERMVVGHRALSQAPSFDLRKEAERIILNRYSPAALIVDADLNIIHFQGDTSPFLKPTPGEASLQLLRIVRPELTLEVRATIQEAKKSNTPVRREKIRFRRNGQTEVTDLEVVPIEGRKAKSTDFVLLFLNPGTVTAEEPQPAAALKPGMKQKRQEVELLKRELASTQDHLRSLLEDQEAASEELRAANEEILSSNEELQSTNEGLETAKEELQSSNEELTTLNEELQNRNAEVTQTASDLNSVLNAVEIPIAILGEDRTVRRFTPAAGKLLNLIASDIGRPIAQIRPNLDGLDLDQMAAEVNKNAVSLEQEARDIEGHWYAVRMRPFQTGEHRIDGVLISFVDIHDVKQYSSAIVETMRGCLLVLDSHFRVLLASAAFYQIFQVRAEETENRLLWELGNGQWNIFALRELLEKVLPEKKEVRDFEVEHNFPGIGHKVMLLNARQLYQAGIGSEKILLVVEDITERTLAERALAAEAVARARLSNASFRLWHLPTLREGLEEMLAASIELMDADMGNIQILDAGRGVLVIAAQRGFEREFLDFFREISAKDDSACGRALRSGQRVVIEDVETDPEYTPLRAIAQTAGYRAVQSTPLIGKDDTPLGMLSTHFRSPHRPNEQSLLWLDLYARQAADFIERCSTEEVLRKSESTVRALLESAAHAILAVDGTGRMELVNATAETMFGYKREEMLSQPVEMLIPSQLQEIHRQHRTGYFSQPRNRSMGIGLDLAGRRKDGSEFPVEVSLSYLESVNGVRAVAFVSDISQRKHAESALSLSRQELQALSARLLTAAEDERRRTASELHDAFGQKLALLNLRASDVETLLPGQPVLAAQKLRACREQIGVVAQEIQEFARTLHPSVLQELGLEVALRSECETYAQRTGTVVNFSAQNVPETVPEDCALCLYRIAQESLQNIWKHAGSNRIDVTLNVMKGEMVLIVEDFGKGFDLETTKGRGGLGLISMQERVRLVGGSLSIKTKAGDGTRVEVYIPLRRD